MESIGKGHYKTSGTVEWRNDTIFGKEMLVAEINGTNDTDTKYPSPDEQCEIPAGELIPAIFRVINNSEALGFTIPTPEQSAKNLHIMGLITSYCKNCRIGSNCELKRNY